MTEIRVTGDTFISAVRELRAATRRWERDHRPQDEARKLQLERIVDHYLGLVDSEADEAAVG